jgi:hypothetical protein
LPRTPPRKSYSGRISSGSDTLSGFFFICRAFRTCRQSCMNQSGHIVTICMGDNEQTLLM